MRLLALPSVHVLVLFLAGRPFLPSLSVLAHNHVHCPLRGNASLCRKGVYVVTWASGRSQMRGFDRPSAKVFVSKWPAYISCANHCKLIPCVYLRLSATRPALDPPSQSHRRRRSLEARA
jgi:hypothetical protein